MTTAKSMPDFRRNSGGAAAEEEAKGRRATFDKVRYAAWEDGETKYIRLIDDSPEWIWVDQHYAPTKGTPPGYAGDKWPQKMYGICRNNRMFKEINYYDGCFLCENPPQRVGKDKVARAEKPSLRLYARAVMRVPVVVKDQRQLDELRDQYPGKFERRRIGDVVGYVDAEVETKETDTEGKETGRVTKGKDVQILNFGMGNFFAQLQASYDIFDRNLLNRDFAVTRKGSGTDTEYRIVPLDPTENHDLSDPDTRERYIHVVDLQKEILDKSSDEYFETFFDTTKPFPARLRKSTEDSEGGDGGEGAPESQQAKPEEKPIDQDRIAAMRERVLGRNTRSE